MDTVKRSTANNGFALTREAALARLEAFAPAAGSAYGRLRNFDLGPESHVHVSRLSAALRRRLVAEHEVVGLVLARHGPEASEKFISEVFWRTYWKGWLEQRPGIWTGYLAAVEHEEQRLAAHTELARRHADAVAGRSQIDCFDAWMRELEDTGYLHNWARMQFASIWIFTLGLPWELGAAHMLARLNDADPACNTLSWRWVAGLHTQGKTYLADAERIARMTDGRFLPRDLSRRAVVPADRIAPVPLSPPRAALAPDLTAQSLLLLSSEDLSLETLPALRDLPVTAIAVLPGETEPDRIAIEDGLSRASTRWPDAAVLGAVTPEALQAATSAGCRQVVTGFVPVGPTAKRMDLVRRQASAEGLGLSEYLRGWDARAWPHCRKGFFGLKENIPALLGAREVNP